MNRATEIKESLKGIGTEIGTPYTHQEIIDRLIALQSALAKGVFEKTHAEHITDREVLRHFEILATDYGLDASERFLRLQRNIGILGHTIANYIKGREGERAAKRALKLISTDKSVRVLYNICLEDASDVGKTEYDAIVVAPYGLFVLEVKNISGTVYIQPDSRLRKEGEPTPFYDLSGRMGMKEALLRVCLGDLFPKKYVSMLVFPNKDTQIVDEYHRQLYYMGEGVSFDIRQFAKSGTILNEKQIAKIVERIKANHKEQKTLCKVNCEEIIDDYAHLMAEIEEAIKEGCIAPETTKEPKTADSPSKRNLFSWKTAVNAAVAVFIGAPITWLASIGLKKLLKGGT